MKDSFAVALVVVLVAATAPTVALAGSPPPGGAVDAAALDAAPAADVGSLSDALSNDSANDTTEVGDGTLSATGTITNDTVAATTEGVEDAESTTTDATNETVSTTDAATDAGSTATDSVNGTGSTTDVVNDTVSTTTDAVNDTVSVTTDTVNETVSTASDAVNDTSSTTTDAVDDTVTTVTNAMDEVTPAGDATGALAAGDVRVTVGTPTPTPHAEDAFGSPPAAGADRATSTRIESRGNASVGADGAPASRTGADGGLPGPTGGALVVGVGAVAALAGRSTALAPVVPDVATTLRRLPSPVARLRDLPPGSEWLRRLPGLFGYSRHDGSDPLEHDTRAALHRQITASPGVYRSELSERTDVPLSTVRYHLDVLEREGLVTCETIRGKRRYFSLGVGNRELLAALEDDALAAVLGCLAEAGPASVSTVAAELGRDASTISHHLSRLESAGLVQREREGPAVYSRLRPEVADALGGGGEGFPRPPRVEIDA